MRSRPLVGWDGRHGDADGGVPRHRVDHPPGRLADPDRDRGLGDADRKAPHRLSDGDGASFHQAGDADGAVVLGVGGEIVVLRAEVEASYERINATMHRLAFGLAGLMIVLTGVVVALAATGVFG